MTIREKKNMALDAIDVLAATKHIDPRPILRALEDIQTHVENAIDQLWSELKRTS